MCALQVKIEKVSFGVGLLKYPSSQNWRSALKVSIEKVGLKDSSLS